MSEKHTAERWIAKEALQSAYEMGETWEIVTAAQGKPIAIVRDSQANARIIAAARELLDAIHAGMEYCEALKSAAENPDSATGYGTVESDKLDTLFERWMELALTALTKVRGQ